MESTRTAKFSCVRGVVEPTVLSLLFFIGLSVPSRAQSEQGSPGSAQSSALETPALASPGTISGAVVDPSGGAIANARVQLRLEGRCCDQEARSGMDGRFSFARVAPGAFELNVDAEGFATQSLSGTLHEGEDYTVEQIALALEVAKINVEVVLPRVEVAEQQIKEQEKQRVLGFLPNFYVSYVPDAAPLTAKQKFQLAWKSTIDPVTLVLTAAVAGVQQAANSYGEYGQGAAGYGKRYAAGFADSMTSTFIGSAILPSIFKQDPRYFYKGKGSTRSRIFYAIEMAVVCRGDNGKLQANYSGILGSLATGAISNLYYPNGNRNDAALTFENTAIGLGTTAAANVLQEFVIRKLTPAGRRRDPPKP